MSHEKETLVSKQFINDDELKEEDLDGVIENPSRRPDGDKFIVDRKLVITPIVTPPWVNARESCSETLVSHIGETPENKYPKYIIDDEEDLTLYDNPVAPTLLVFDKSKSQHKSKIEKWKALLKWSLRVEVIILSLLMFVTACIGLSSVQGAEKSDKTFVAIYMLFFSIFLLVFEGIHIRYVEWIDHIFKRNFGFMYSVMGKSCFLIFIAFLSVALGSPLILSMVTGSLFIACGCAHLVVLLKYPQYFEPIDPLYSQASKYVYVIDC